MGAHITSHRDGFGPGRTTVVSAGDDDSGMDFAVVRWAAGERVELTTEQETAWLLMQGRLRVTFGGDTHTISRDSLFDELPWALHVAAGEAVVFVCETDVEVTEYGAANRERFDPVLYGPDDVRNERRGKGALRDASFRFVRTIFDDTNTSKNAQLVLGEVVNLPGRWSSYPPHHHPQNEIYHYRFTDPRGYGHAELGEDVKKVRPNDTIKIQGGLDHSQCAAPGYGMYYAWVIRHLPERRYDVPDFTEAHTWTMKPGADGWWPSGE
ncbi:MAG: 5-deoxy-glucuronate isomerase [Deltaproteobacteria bacterium]|jgi:5-deoxy-glucuronate isomerase